MELVYSIFENKSAPQDWVTSTKAWHFQSHMNSGPTIFKKKPRSLLRLLGVMEMSFHINSQKHVQVTPATSNLQDRAMCNLCEWTSNYKLPHSACGITKRCKVLYAFLTSPCVTLFCKTSTCVWPSRSRFCARLEYHDRKSSFWKRTPYSFNFRNAWRSVQRRRYT